MSLNDYLTKYLTKDESAEKKAKKQRKKEREQQRAANALNLVDDDALGWEKNGEDDEDDEDAPVVINDRGTAQFRKAKNSQWSSVVTNEDALAESILADTAKENAAAAAQLASDEAPMILSNNNDDIQTMESGARAGLQSAAQVTAAIKKKRDAEIAAFASADAVAAGKGAETIYRDASGRIINIQLQRAEARKKQAEEEAKAAEQAKLNRGDVQLAREAAHREALEKAKFAPFARKADDEEMNRELKEVDRWNDPAAAFLTKKKQGMSVSGLPLYKGHAPPNRYGILPGHRWDGVDRGNGTEALFFKKRNEAKDRTEMEYAWQMDM